MLSVRKQFRGKGAGILTRGKKIFRVLLKVFSGIISFALLALTCLALILAQPQEDGARTPDPQPSLAPSPAVTIYSEAELPELLSAFPVPVMSFVSGSGLTMVSGSARDITVDGKTGRISTLEWQTPDGQTVALQSIYPADALSALDPRYHFGNKLGPTLFGSDSVYMESAGAVRLHASTDSALYVVIAPPALKSSLPALSRSLQLLSPQ